MDKLSSGAGSVILPLAMGAASVFAPRLASGVMGGLQLAQHASEKAEKKTQIGNMRSWLLGGGNPAAPPEGGGEQPQPQPGQPGQPPPGQLQPQIGQQPDWRRRLSDVLPPEVIKNAPDAILPNLMTQALAAVAKPESKLYWDQQNNRMISATPGRDNQWSFNEVPMQPKMPEYGPQLNARATAASGGEHPTFASLMKGNPQLGQQVYGQEQNSKANIGADFNEVSIPKYGLPYNQLSPEQARSMMPDWVEFTRFKNVAIPTERVTSEQAAKWAQEGKAMRPLMVYQNGQINTYMVPRNADIHVPAIMGAGEPRAESGFIQKSLNIINKGSDEQQAQAAADLTQRGFTVTENPTVTQWLLGRYNVKPPGAAQPGPTPGAPAPAPTPAPATPTAPAPPQGEMVRGSKMLPPAPAQTPQKKQTPGRPGAGYSPPWASDYKRR